LANHISPIAIKCRRALQQTGLPRLIIAGGVGANLRLRQALTQLAKTMGVTLFYPRIEFCTDNAAMIAYTGCIRLMQGQTETLNFNVRARWPLDGLR
jgi:N6-L-threonylcarbamoyladenine synthase